MPVEPGDTLYVHQDGLDPVSVSIVDLTARVDRDADTISGTAPANIASTNPDNPPVLRLEATGINHHDGDQGWGDKYITTGATGAYNASFTYTSPAPGTLDLRPPVTYGYLTHTNAQGNQVSLRYNAPEVRVQENSYYVSGYAENNATYTVTLKTGGRRDQGPVHRTGQWLRRWVLRVLAGCCWQCDAKPGGRCGGDGRLAGDHRPGGAAHRHRRPGG